MECIGTTLACLVELETLLTRMNKLTNINRHGVHQEEEMGKNMRMTRESQQNDNRMKQAGAELCQAQAKLG